MKVITILSFVIFLNIVIDSVRKMFEARKAFRIYNNNKKIRFRDIR